MCDGVVPSDSSWSMSGHQESVGVHVDAHSQHVVFHVVSWCGPFRHPLPRHREGPIISTHGCTPRPVRLSFVSLAREGLTQEQECARPTDVRSHGSRVQTPSRQAGLKGFEPLTYRCPSDVPMERADKSRSLYLAKLQARGG